MTKSRLDLLGQWPVPGKELREKKEMMIVKSDETLDLIHGKDNHVLVSFFVSNDFIHFGTMTIPVNGASDYEDHKGDEFIYCLEGTISIVVHEDTEVVESLRFYRYEVKKGQCFFIPERMKHRYINLSDDTCKLMFSIAPEL